MLEVESVSSSGSFVLQSEFHLFIQEPFTFLSPQANNPYWVPLTNVHLDSIADSAFNKQSKFHQSSKLQQPVWALWVYVGIYILKHAPIATITMWV